MKRRIAGYHRDEEGHWVADLECGHTLHLRHQPPWTSRPWVTTAEGRTAHLGMELECRNCGEADRLDEAARDRRMSARWIGVADAATLRETAFRRIVAAAGLAIESRGHFVIVLAGGNTPRSVYAMLREAKTDWARWHVYFGDERCLPHGDPQRNDRMAGDALLDHVPIPRSQVHGIPAELGALEGALAYREALRDAGAFDLVLLGLGEDGHTASLFPGHDLGVEPGAPDALPVVGAPKPPPQRVTLSAARLGRARAVLFLVEGESKRDAVRRWRAGDDIPARAIRPEAGCDVLATSGLLR